MAYRKLLLIMLTFLLMAMLSATAALAADDSSEFTNETCLQCHGAKNFSVEREGKSISLFVNIDQFQSSIHGTNDCTSCHADITNIPHTDVVYGKQLADRVAQQCQSCHAGVNAEYRNSVHGQLEAKGEPTALCADCHGSHNVRKKEDAKALINRSNITNTCTKCHDGEVAESYAESFHGKAVYLGSSKAATCADCHTGHSILGPDDPKSTVNKANVPETCASCHYKEQPNFAAGKEHWVFEPSGPGAPMYWTLKFFTWLTIMTITLLIIHIEMELFRKLKEAKAGNSGQH